jgi:transposase
VLDSDRSSVEVAKSLGISESTLGHWVAKARKKNGGAGGKEPLSEAEKRIQELERELAQAQMDIAFLKKAASFFASQQK